jgi:hypothetical protein
MVRRKQVLGTLLLCALFAGSVLVGCSSSSSTPPNPGARGSIYDRNGILLAYTEANAQAAGGYQRRYCFPSLSPIIGYFHPSFGEAGAVVVMRENGDEGFWQAPIADCIYLGLLNLPNVHKSYHCAS